MWLSPDVVAELVTPVDDTGHVTVTVAGSVLGANANTVVAENVAPAALPVFHRPMMESTMNNIQPTGRGHDLALNVTYGADSHCSLPANVTALDHRAFTQATIPDSNHAAFDWTDKDEWADHAGNAANWGIFSAAAGVVLQVRARNPTTNVLCSPAGPNCQQEVYIEHTVGSGLYREDFVTYYAHMDIAEVGIGDTVTQGQLVGIVGATGTGSGGTEHLHFGTFRLTNTSTAHRVDWETLFGTDATTGKAIHIQKTAIDPFGWSDSSCVDPWGRQSTQGAMSIFLWDEYYDKLDWSHH